MADGDPYEYEDCPADTLRREDVEEEEQESHLGESDRYEIPSLRRIYHLEALA